MFFERFLRFSTFTFFVLAGITWVQSEDIGEGFSGRLAAGDLVGLVLLFLFLFRLLSFRTPLLYFTKEYMYYVPLLIVFGLGAIFAEYPQKASMEFLIHIFTFLVSFALFNLYRNKSAFRERQDTLEIVFKLLLHAGALLALINLLQFFFFPHMIHTVAQGGIAATFRNTGQAGSFFGTYLAVLCPALLSGFIKKNTKNIILFCFVLLAFLFTFKRAALIGFFVGIGLIALLGFFSVKRANKKMLLICVVLGAVMFPLFQAFFSWGLDNVSGMQWRVERKFNRGVLKKFSEGFAKENILASVDAFESSPLLGVGLGNVAGNFTRKFEIHSTYLAVLGNSGILGCLAYCLFISNFLFQVVRGCKKIPSLTRHALFLEYFTCMFLGLVISWAYTYHLRKREFWIMFFIVSLVRYTSREIVVARVPVLRENSETLSAQQ